MPIVIDRTPFRSLFRLAEETGFAQKEQLSQAREDQLAQLIRENNFRNKQLRFAKENREDQQEFQKSESALDRTLQEKLAEITQRGSTERTSIQDAGNARRDDTDIMQQLIRDIPQDIQAGLKSGQLFYTPSQKRQMSALIDSIQNPRLQKGKIGSSMQPKLVGQYLKVRNNPAGVGLPQPTAQEQFESNLVERPDGNYLYNPKTGNYTYIGKEKEATETKRDKIRTDIINDVVGSFILQDENGNVRFDEAAAQQAVNFIDRVLSGNLKDSGMPPPITQNDIMREQGQFQEEPPPPPPQGQVGSPTPSLQPSATLNPTPSLQPSATPTPTPTVDPVSGKDISFIKGLNQQQEAPPPSPTPSPKKLGMSRNRQQVGAKKLGSITKREGTASNPHIINDISKIKASDLVDGKFYSFINPEGERVTLRWDANERIFK